MLYSSPKTLGESMVTKNDFIKLGTYLGENGITDQRVTMTLVLLDDLAHNKTTDISSLLKPYFDTKKEGEPTVSSLVLKDVRETKEDLLEHSASLLLEPIFEGDDAEFLKNWIEISLLNFDIKNETSIVSASPVSILEDMPLQIDKKEDCPNISAPFGLMLDLADMKSPIAQSLCQRMDLKEDSEIATLLSDGILPMILSAPTYEKFISSWNEFYQRGNAICLHSYNLSEKIQALTPYPIALAEIVAPKLPDAKMGEQIINSIKEMYALNVLSELNGKFSRCKGLDVAFKLALEDPSFSELFERKNKTEIITYFMNKLRSVSLKDIPNIKYHPLTPTQKTDDYIKALTKIIDYVNIVQANAKIVWLYHRLLPKLQEFDI